MPCIAVISLSLGDDIPDTIPAWGWLGARYPDSWYGAHEKKLKYIQ